MQLDRISANIRQRTPWEAVDLGFAMARQWFLPLWSLWFATALPVALLTTLLLHQWPWAVALVLWWFKPLYEPLMLFWLSRRLFGEELSIRQTLRQWRPVLAPRLFANLSLRRLSSNRSFFMPVSHLEGLRGAERVKRLQILSTNHSTGTWLTLGGVHFEGVLQISFILLLLYMIPDQLVADQRWEILSSGDSISSWIGNVVALSAMSIIAPFYVAGGFALYLTRRSVLEAWDLELAFRRMAPRFKPAKIVRAALLGATLLIGTSWPTAETWALGHAEAGALIAEVLADEDFGSTRIEKYWRYTQDSDQSWEWRPNWDFSWISGIAELLEYLLWIAAVALLGWLLLYLTRFTNRSPLRRAARGHPPPSVLFGLPVTPESLPKDIVGAVSDLLREEQLRPALSLLYRATLAHLVLAHHIRIADSATEGECERIVNSQRPAAEGEFFSRLTRAWVWCAYGHLAPVSREISALAAAWHQLYGMDINE